VVGSDRRAKRSLEPGDIACTSDEVNDVCANVSTGRGYKMESGKMARAGCSAQNGEFFEAPN
jgi:hypothetical protein